MSIRRVAVFGFYGVGNFGDDLMAWMIAKELRSKNHHVILFSLGDAAGDSLQCSDFTEQGLASSRAIDRTVDSCDAVIYGGGGILVGRSESRLKRFRRHFSRERQFLDAVRLRHLPLMVMTVGGDGRTEPDRLDPFPRDLLGHATTITVRNPSDVVLLRNLGVASIHAPDMVWGARQMLAAPPRHGEGLRIGLDLYPSVLKGPGGLRFLAFLQALILRHRSAQFVFLNSRHVSAGFDPGLSHLLCGDHVSRYRFREFYSDVGELSSLDLLISSRLHVPMLALQYGVPVISAFAEPKTLLMLRDAGLDFATFTHDMLPELRSLLWDRSRLEGWIDAFWQHPHAWTNDAWRAHFQHLDVFLQTALPT